MRSRWSKTMSKLPLPLNDVVGVCVPAHVMQHTVGLQGRHQLASDSLKSMGTTYEQVTWRTT